MARFAVLTPSTLVARIASQNTTRNFTTTPRHLTSSTSALAGKQNSRPGWEGRHGDDHVVKRDPLDAQAEPSQQALKEKQAPHENKEGGQGISEKDEGNHNKKAKEDHPEAPEPVIGMNSERGSKGGA